jgi:hypothetical protein
MNKWTVLKLLQNLKFLLKYLFLSLYLMSLVIEGEHLHNRLCLMCNPIGYCIIKLCTLFNKIFELKIETV